MIWREVNFSPSVVAIYIAAANAAKPILIAAINLLTPREKVRIENKIQLKLSGA